jgi:hypothetical protein
VNFVAKVEERIRNELEPKKLQEAYTLRENVLRLSKEMEIDRETIEISALLLKTGKTQMESSMKALALLSELQYNEEKKHKIAKLIHNHPFDSFILEQRILFEADKKEEKSLIERIKSFLGNKK